MKPVPDLHFQMPDYPDKAHPPLGICVTILVILNVSFRIVCMCWKIIFRVGILFVNR